MAEPCAAGQSTSLARQHLHSECEMALNKQINMELQLSYLYQAMAYHCDRSDVALPNFVKFFQDLSCEEREHAEEFMEYLVMRGGRLRPADIRAPKDTEWTSALQMMEVVLDEEKRHYLGVLKVREFASKHKDASLESFLDKEFVQEEVEFIKEFADHVRNLQRVGPGLGEYQFERLTAGNKFHR